MIAPEMVAKLVACCPDYALGHAYELLASGRCPTVDHAINAARKGEKMRNGGKKNVRAFSDLDESGRIDVSATNCVDLQLTDAALADMTADLIGRLDEDGAIALESVLRGERLQRSADADRVRRVKLRRKCAEVLGLTD